MLALCFARVLVFGGLFIGGDLSVTKTQAVGLFRTRRALADALGITPSAISQWPEELPTRLADEIVGAALRCRLLTPERAAEWLGAAGDGANRNGAVDAAPVTAGLGSVRRSG